MPLIGQLALPWLPPWEQLQEKLTINHVNNEEEGQNAWSRKVTRWAIW